MAVTPLQPTTSHLAEPALSPFLDPAFDAAAFWNSALPPLHFNFTPATQRQANSVLASDVSTQTTQLLSQLNTNSSRLTTALTQLTDDIIRSGSRLAYEVEVLRGESATLCEVLNENLKSDVELFVPDGLSTATIGEAADSVKTTKAGGDNKEDEPPIAVANEPDYITSLRTLVSVRTRLESIITLFGEAMQWTLPTSDNSSSNIAGSFITVSPPTPEPTGASRAQEDSHDDKGREFAANLQAEILELIISDPERSLSNGRQKAEQRIEALRDLARVWKDTAEEKARVRFVESLVKLADDRVKELEREADGTGNRLGAANARRKTGAPTLKAPAAGRQEKGSFLDNLYKLRGNNTG